MESKKCFECRKLKTLDCFPVNTRKYQLKADLGRCIVCHSCTKARALRDRKLVVFNHETDKFDIIEFKSKNQIDKYFKDMKMKAKIC